MKMTSPNISQLTLDIDNVNATMNISNIIAIQWVQHNNFSGTGNTSGCIGLYDDTVGTHIFIIILLLLNIFLHTTGCHLLYSMQREGKGSVQQLLILNLSITELLKNLNKLFRYIVTLSGQFYVLPTLVCDVYAYVKLFHRWGSYLLYFVMMVYITVDRLLRTLLRTYKVYFPERRAKRLLIVTWVLVILLVVVMSLAKYKGLKTPPLLPAYIYAALHIFFAILAICTYTLMFHKLAGSHQLHGFRKGRSKDGILGSKNQSGFFICILIITSFCILAIIPGLVYIYLILNNIHKKYPHTKLAVHICFMLSDTVDACIYIFLQRSIRNILVEKVGSIYKWCVCTKTHDTDHTLGESMPIATESTSVSGMEMVQMLNTSQSVA